MRAYWELYARNLEDRFEPASPTLVAAGALMLFCNWLMFNGGSSYTLADVPGKNSAQKVMVNTILCGAVCSVGALTA
jgi:ammonia channel protein AmtB